MRAILLAVILLCPSISSAQVVQVQQQKCGPIGCRIGIGSGVVIGRTALPTGATQYAVLTVAHNAGVLERHRWNQSANHNLSIVTPHGKYPARIVQCDGPAWLMLLTFVDTSGQQIPIMRIANSIPQAGESVTIQGYSMSRQGQLGRRSLTLRSIGSTNFTTTSPFEQGESGGPVCARNGEIVGLCEGFLNETKVGYGPSVIAIRRFLRLPDIGSGSQFAGQGQGQVSGFSQQSAVPMPSGLPMQPGSVPVQQSREVPAPPIPVDSVEPIKPAESVADAPKYQPPVHRPRGVLVAPEPGTSSNDSAGLPSDPAIANAAGANGDRRDPTPATPRSIERPVAEPDPISHPVETPATGDTPSPGERIPPRQPSASGSTASTVISNASKVVSTGLDWWSLAAGAGLVAGTGGVGGLALLAWRGVKAAKTLKDLRAGKANVDHGGNHQTPRPDQSTIGQPQPPRITNPQVPQPKQQQISLPPHEVNWVQVPVDFRKESVDYALAETVRVYPGLQASMSVFQSLVNQHLQGHGHGPETLHDVIP